MSSTSSTTKKKTTAARSTSARSRAATPKTRAATKSTKRTTAIPVAASSTDRLQAAAERAMLVPLGAALTAYDRAAQAVTELDFPPSLLSKEELERRIEKRQKQARADIKRFEARGSKARNRFEREAKKTRTRIERELRQRREGLGFQGGFDLSSKLDRVTAIRSDVVRQGGIARENIASKLAPVSDRVESAVGVGQRVVATAQERINTVI